MSSQNYGQPIPSPHQEEAPPAGAATPTPSGDQPSPGSAAESSAQQGGELGAPEQTPESTPASSGGDAEPGGYANEVEAVEDSEQPLPPGSGESVEERVSKLERRQEEVADDGEQPSASHGMFLEERVLKLEQWQETMNQQFKQQQQQLEEKDNQIMRRAAEFENFRRRSERDRDKLRLRRTCEVLREILPIVDNFERARKALSPEKLETLHAQDVHQDYQGIYKQLVTALKRLNVSSMKVEGQVFDPSLHEAVMREPSQDHEEDMVMEELQRGYHLDGEVLRHAMVKVSMGPGPN
ncbi:MAG: nucleotide exchange factor GrpE [Cyanobacteria bacterium MAG CAR4_bin_6]|nr:nucleotide exchange factor GrpE [Cyanobacteria bacterium MAG CAR4_bin_6]MCY4234807.1 nucleotide exchange factor GrpE [Cyanobacteria bacterium MAG CAR2_bin_4]